MNSSVLEEDLVEAKQHLVIALGEMTVLPNTHESLIENFRDYFENQKVAVFSRLLNAKGETGLREFVNEVVVESGYYELGEDGQLRPKN